MPFRTNHMVGLNLMYENTTLEGKEEFSVPKRPRRDAVVHWKGIISTLPLIRVISPPMVNMCLCSQDAIQCLEQNLIGANGDRTPVLRLDDGTSTANDLKRIYVYNNVVNIDPYTPELQLNAKGGAIGLKKFQKHEQTGILTTTSTVNDGSIAVFGEQNGAIVAGNFSCTMRCHQQLCRRWILHLTK